MSPAARFASAHVQQLQILAECQRAATHAQTCANYLLVQGITLTPAHKDGLLGLMRQQAFNPPLLLISETNSTAFLVRFLRFLLLDV
jgi:hypothetical protein